MLKRRLRGILFSVATAAGLYLLISAAVQEADKIAAKIANGEIPLDPEIVMQQVTQAASLVVADSAGSAGIVILAAWLIAIVDALFGPGKVELQEKEHKHSGAK